MAKRFTDTDKWGKPGFDGLSLKMKVVWVYLCDNCDHAGIWDINFRLMSFQIGVEVTQLEIEQAFGDKAQFISSTKLFLPAFIDFQYGDLNPENRVHQSVISRLKKLGAYKDLTSPIHGAKDKDKDKDKEKAKDSLEKGSGEKPFKPDLEKIYKLYPCKKGKSRGLALLTASVRSAKDEEECHKALATFLAHHVRAKTEAQFIPQFKTWASSWTDWLDPEHGKSEGFGQSTEINWDKVFQKPEGAA